MKTLVLRLGVPPWKRDHPPVAGDTLTIPCIAGHLQVDVILDGPPTIVSKRWPAPPATYLERDGNRWKARDRTTAIIARSRGGTIINVTDKERVLLYDKDKGTCTQDEFVLLRDVFTSLGRIMFPNPPRITFF